MEPQEKIYVYANSKDDKCTKKRNCLGIVAVILLALFGTAIGLIIGAAVSAAILSALSAVIVLSIVLGLLLILTLIMMICNKTKQKKCKCCC